MTPEVRAAESRFGPQPNGRFAGCDQRSSRRYAFFSDRDQLTYTVDTLARASS
jgi:hypothetical protein